MKANHGLFKDAGIRMIAGVLYAEGTTVRPRREDDVMDLENISSRTGVVKDDAYRGIRRLSEVGYVYPYFTSLGEDGGRVYMGFRISDECMEAMSDLRMV